MPYSQLVEFCGNERQAWYLSTRLPYQNMNEDQLVTEILKIMCRARERVAGPAAIEYIGGQRRDTLRLP
jgi:hypothetical protein